MMCNGSATYCNLYDSSQITVKKLSNSAPSTILTIKPYLTLNLNFDYCAEVEIAAGIKYSEWTPCYWEIIICVSEKGGSYISLGVGFCN